MFPSNSCLNLLYQKQIKSPILNIIVYFLDTIRLFTVLVCLHKGRCMGNSIEKEHDQKEKIKHLSKELRTVRRNLVEQFYTDPLTRLPNLYQLRHDLEEISDFTLIIANIDNFKLLNDFYGFVVGDFILESFSKKLETELKNFNF